MIRKIQMEDMDSCAEIMMSVYNNEQWQCNWDFKAAKAYLLDYYEASKFIGFVLVIDEKIRGAIFCHEKIWWNNSEVFVDEMFICPKLQRKGYGTELLKMVESYIKSIILQDLHYRQTALLLRQISIGRMDLQMQIIFFLCIKKCENKGEIYYVHS